MPRKRPAQPTDEKPDPHYTLNEPLDAFEPDWGEVWTAQRAEAELKDFIFKGIGWYFLSKDTLLVLPYGTSDGTKHADTFPQGAKLYRFLVYNGRNPSATFNWLINAPTRQDDR
jgi:hypothetical protein